MDLSKNKPKPGLLEFGPPFVYAGRAGAHEFNQIGLGFAPPPAQARVERASLLTHLTHL